MRDKMLQEAKIKQQSDMMDRQNEEKARVMKLAMEIEKEREHKVNKKKVEREAAMKVIQDNNVEKKKQMFAREAQKKKEADDV